MRHAGREVEVEAPGDLASKPPPEWLTTQQKKFWGEALADAPKGLLRRADWAMFVGYVETWDRYTRLVQAQQRLDADLDLPFLVRGSGGPALSPYLRAMNHCLMLLIRIETELGFTPTARVHFGRREDDQDDAANDEWAALRRLRVIDGDKE